MFCQEPCERSFEVLNGTSRYSCAAGQVMPERMDGEEEEEAPGGWSLICSLHVRGCLNVLRAC